MEEPGRKAGPQLRARRTAALSIRTSPEALERWRQAARCAGVSFTDWIEYCLNCAVVGVVAKDFDGSRAARPPIRVWQCVTFQFGNRQIIGQVVEDLGCIGPNDRRLLRIRFDIGTDEPLEIKIPAEEVLDVL